MGGRDGETDEPGATESCIFIVAEDMYADPEAWYDAHPEASFEEIEDVAREKRRELMGAGLGILVNGRDSGYALEGQWCSGCGAAMQYKGEGFGRTIHGVKRQLEMPAP